VVHLTTELLDELYEPLFLDVLLPMRDNTVRLSMVATPSRELKVLLQRMKVFIPNRKKWKAFCRKWRDFRDFLLLRKL
jgi:hypothetical protein